MKIENVALRVRLVVFAISLLAFVLPAAADTTLTVEVDGSEKTLDAISTSYSSKRYWGVSKSDESGIIKSVTTSKTSSSSTSTSTTIVLTGKTGTATVTVFYSSSSSPKSGTTANTITVNAKSPPPPEEVAVAVHETKSFDFTWTADSNNQYWQVVVKSGGDHATAQVDNPGDYNTKPQGVKTKSNKITITGVAVGSASFTVQNKSTSNNAWANFKTYNVTVTNPYTVIPTPTAEAGLAYDGESHQGVKAGEHYTLGGTYTAVNAGTYEATVTPKSGYCWEDGSVVAKAIKWTIARRQATVMVVNTNKVEGAVFIDSDQQTYNDPIWTTTTEGLIASDTTELMWDIFRTNACEEVGTYDLLVEGATKQGNYDLTFVGGKYEICEAPPPTFTITVTRDAGIADITNGTASVFSGAEKSAAVELEAGTKTVTLALAADRMTIPIYKVITNDVTNVTTRVATYAIAEGCTLTFSAEEAKVDDPAVTDEQTTAAIIAAIDGEEGEKTHDDAVAKVETITAGEEGGRAVEPKDLATWITDKQISSTSIAQSDYVAASVHFNTSAPITGEAKVEFTEIGEVSSDAFTFAFEVTLDGKETPEELNLVKEFVAGCIETTGDLGEGFAGTVDPNRVTIEDGKVKITPDPEKTAEFFKIVIPKDPIR